MKTKLLLAVFTIIAFSVISNAQTQTTETLTFDSEDREYIIYTPASYDGSVAYPLLFAFHGGGGYAADFIQIADFRSIADTANFILVYPQALGDPTDDIPGSPNWIRKNQPAFDDLTFVDALLDTIITGYNVNTTRVYATGYSLGGEFTFELGCRLNNRIAAIGVVARTMGVSAYNNCTPTHSTGVMTVLGTADYNSLYDGVIYQGIEYYKSAADMHHYWATQNNCDTNPVTTNVANTNTTDGSTVERSTWSTENGCTYVEELKVIDGGHDWPGSFGNMDIDASAEIWQFVSHYDINGIIGCITTSISDINSSLNQFKVFPNPFDQELTIELKSKQSNDFSIYNINGEIVTSGTLNSQVNTIDLSSLGPNVYILNIENESIRLIKTK
ncbi:T9SS type A sorting domain-containing protein [Cyclobacteriaceae bacterium]|nr:T9SS type A sorting domain-containing protein [Cyclobacteriaceae bacterium]MDB4742773.1 T9SS type A sorting domain-containing protein [Cyclobacteriaceae bacterium]